MRTAVVLFFMLIAFASNESEAAGTIHNSIVNKTTSPTNGAKGVEGHLFALPEGKSYIPKKYREEFQDGLAHSYSPFHKEVATSISLLRELNQVLDHSKLLNSSSIKSLAKSHEQDADFPKEALPLLDAKNKEESHKAAERIRDFLAYKLQKQFLKFMLRIEVTSAADLKKAQDEEKLAQDY